MPSHLVTQTPLGWTFASVACAHGLLDCVLLDAFERWRHLDRDTKTNWTAHRRDVKAQKPHQLFGRRCYLRINSATVIRSVNAFLFIVFPPLSAKWAFFMHTNHLEAIACSLSSVAHLDLKVKVEKVSERCSLSSWTTVSRLLTDTCCWHVNLLNIRCLVRFYCWFSAGPDERLSTEATMLQ